MSSCKNKVHSIFGFKMRFKVAETHHGYYGLALMVWGAWWMLLANWWGIPIFTLGAYLLWDDFILQHHRQVFEFNPCYHSPVHRFIYDYLKLYDRAWYRALNKFADWLFARPLLLAILIALIVVLYLILKGG